LCAVAPANSGGGPITFEKGLARHRRYATQSLNSALESEVKEIRSLFLAIKGDIVYNTQKTDGFEAIRTPDLRRVKAKDLDLFKAFVWAISLLERLMTRHM